MSIFAPAVSVLAIALGASVAGTVVFVVIPIIVCTVIWCSVKNKTSQQTATVVTAMHPSTTTATVVTAQQSQRTAGPTPAPSYPVHPPAEAEYYKYPKQEPPPPYTPSAYPLQQQQGGYPLHPLPPSEGAVFSQPGIPPQQPYPAFY